MAEQKKTPIVIDDVEYFFEDMTTEQQTMVNHIADLDRKLNTTLFNADQLNVGKNAYVNMLKNSLNTVEEAAAEETVQ